jgi:hypothetical protein
LSTKLRAPIEIDITEMNVPIHLPNKIPEKLKLETQSLTR